MGCIAHNKVCLGLCLSTAKLVINEGDKNL